MILAGASPFNLYKNICSAENCHRRNAMKETVKKDTNGFWRQ